MISDNQDLQSVFNTSFSSIVSNQVLETIFALVSQIDSTLIGMCGLELNLTEQKDESDFLLCIVNSEENIHASLNWLQAAPSSQPFYGYLRSFFENEVNQESHFRNGINNIWLEYDYKNIVDGTFSPSIFFAPKLSLNVFDLMHLNLAFFKHFQQQDFDQKPFTHFFGLLKYLPKDAVVLQIGMMLARKSSNLRLFIQNLKENEIAHFLKNLEWAGDTSSLGVFVKSCQEWNESVDLDIDLYNGIESVIGLECYPKSKKDLVLFLDFLAKGSLISIDGKEKVLSYCHDLVNQPISEFKKVFHHIKVIWDINGISHVKAYFGLKKKK